MKTLALAALALVCVLCVPGPACSRDRAPTTGFLFQSLKVRNQEYPYAVYVPRSYDGSRKWPLIVFLHGYGESGTDGTKMVIQGVGSAIQWDSAKWPFI